MYVMTLKPIISISILCVCWNDCNVCVRNENTYRKYVMKCVVIWKYHYLNLYRKHSSYVVVYQKILMWEQWNDIIDEIFLVWKGS